MLDGGGGMNVIIRTPDQRVKDIHVTCEPTWTVAELKQQLSKLYPGNPTKDRQRLILAGKLLQDATQLEELFKMYDEYQPIIHFVCTQTLTESQRSEMENKASTSTAARVPAAPATVIDGPTAQPVRPQLPPHSRWNNHVNQIQQWHQQLAQYNQQHHPPPSPTPAVVQPLPQQEPPPPQVAPPAAAPPAPPVEQEEPHDLLDVFYLFIRCGFFLALAWNYASPAKFCFMWVFLFYTYLYQMGYIQLPDFVNRLTQRDTEVAGQEPSFLTVLRKAIISFFTSLMPSSEP